MCVCVCVYMYVYICMHMVDSTEKCTQWVFNSQRKHAIIFYCFDTCKADMLT